MRSTIDVFSPVLNPMAALVLDSVELGLGVLIVARNLRRCALSIVAGGR